MPPRSSSQEAQREEYSSDFLIAIDYRASGEDTGVWLILGQSRRAGTSLSLTSSKVCSPDYLGLLIDLILCFRQS